MASVITHPTRILKTRDVLVRVGAVDGVNRPSVNYRQGSDRTEITRINNGPLAMYEFQGATTANYQVSDDETGYRLIGDAGWGDGVITNSRVQMSVTAYFLKNLEWVGDPLSPTYIVSKGKFDECHSVVSRFKNNKDFEAWIEIWKLVDTIDNGASVYDVNCFGGVVMNYQEQYPADGLVEVSFDVMSRGEAYMGLFDAMYPIRTGLPNRLILPGLPTYSPLGALVRQVRTQVEVATVATTVTLAGGLTGVDVATPVTFAFLDGANTALAQLAAAPDISTKPLARIVRVSDKSFVPASMVVTPLTGLVELTPDAPLAAATEYYAEILTGAMTQEVDPLNIATATGVFKPLVGVRSGNFTTA